MAIVNPDEADIYSEDILFDNETSYNSSSYYDNLNYTDGNVSTCSNCTNALCIPDNEFELYLSYVSVDTFESVAIALNIIVFLAGIIGNLLVFIAVTTTKSMQSVTNIFIVNLAMADMLVMLFCAPPSVIWDVTNTWIFGSLMCRIVIYIQDLSVSVSVLTLTFIAYDRYNAICRPLQFSTRPPGTKAAVVIGAIWIVSGMIGIPDAVTLYLDTPGIFSGPCISGRIFFDLSSCEPSWSPEVDFFFYIVKAILLYTLPLIFMSVAYYHIVKTLWRRNNLPGSQDNSETTTVGNNQHDMQQQVSQNSVGNGNNLLGRSSTRRVMRFVRQGTAASVDEHTGTSPSVSTIATQNSANRNLDNQLKTRRKVAKMLIAVVCMFSINFFPVHTLPIIRYILENTTEEDSPMRHALLEFLRIKAGIITHCMCYFNSAINPIIYYFMSAQFKAQYRRILSCRCTADSPPVNQGANRGPMAAFAGSGTRVSNPQRSGTTIVRGSVTQLNAHGAHAHTHTAHTRSRSCHQNNGDGILLRELQQPRVIINNGQLDTNETDPFLRPSNKSEKCDVIHKYN